MAYCGRWNATDQVPERAIDAGIIDRFGSLNPSDGGESSRSSLSFNRLTAPTPIRCSSRRTSFATSSICGRRSLTTSRIRSTAIRCCSTTIAWCTASRARRPGSRICGPRRDRTSSASRHAWMTSAMSASFPRFQRQILDTKQNAGVVESNAALYVENTMQWREWLQHGPRACARIYSTSTCSDKMLNADGSCNHPQRSARLQHRQPARVDLQSEARRHPRPLGADHLFHQPRRRLPQQRCPRRDPQRRRTPQRFAGDTADACHERRRSGSPVSSCRAGRPRSMCSC